jgi:FtsP/CotA-like multicopper oxidase with cupredoxin domain
MIVRPVGGTGTAYGTPESTFDDETALVLSEVDPAFSADPTGFDLRNFQPVYRLINGKAYPETDPVATASGHRVQLRYLNAGVTAHAMGTLGAEQSVLATDAHPAEVPRFKVSDSIAPGSTEDTLVT